MSTSQSGAGERPLVLIAGAGIAGLALALTCEQIGVPVRVFESVRELSPLGVGINLQPNAVRELYDLGLEDELAELGVPIDEWVLASRSGVEVWSEPRGLAAGYLWPQYAVHRGDFQMLLYRKVIERLGPEAIVPSRRVVGYQSTDDGVEVELDHRDGTTSTATGTVLVAGDGLHSAVRQQMFPDQGPPHWGGAILWRGTSVGPPIRTGASFVLAGTLEQRFVHYPISKTDPETGLQLQNWIAELTVDPGSRPVDSSWNKEVTLDTFIGAFADWRFDWLDVPAFIASAGRAWEFPMVDRDPIPYWVDGRVALMGDAAHVMYPVGSNGASQAIVDARVLGAMFLKHGVTPVALNAYQDRLHDDISALVLRNRGNGPIALLGLVAQAGGVADGAAGEDAVPYAEREAFMAGYKVAAGFDRDTLNNADATINVSTVSDSNVGGV